LPTPAARFSNGERLAGALVKIDKEIAGVMHRIARS
jgi:hypothetical protein